MSDTKYTEQDIIDMNMKILQQNEATLVANNKMAVNEHQAKMELFAYQRAKVMQDIRDRQEMDLMGNTMDFHKTFGHPVLNEPTIPAEERWRLRIKLLREEVDELEKAFEEGNLVEVADAQGDIAYILGGTIHETGTAMVMSEVFDEIHSSNMSKACVTEEEAKLTIETYAKQGIECSYILRDGQYVILRDEDNKVMKSINYNKPDIGSILFRK